MCPVIAALAVIFVTSFAAASRDLTICARVGPLISNRGGAIAFGSRLLPPLWAVVRPVDFQVCSAEGRPIQQRFFVEVLVEPLTPDAGIAWLGDRSVWTDERGRFRGMYGAGNRHPGAAWPEGVPSADLLHFRIDGRTVATYMLRREANDIRFAPSGVREHERPHP